MAEKRRLERLSEQLRVELGSLVNGELDDPRVDMVTVTHVRLSSDMRHARVYVSALEDGEDRESALEGLDSAKGFLRRQLSHRLPRLKRTPELTFEYDPTVEEGTRIQELLEQIHPKEDMIEEISKIIHSHDSFVVVSHVRPDGDSLGSQLALALMLQTLGKQVDVLSHDPVPARYRDLPGAEQVRVATQISQPREVTFVLECSNIDRPGIGGLDTGFVVNIDHHHSTQPFGDLSWIDPSACAVGQMIYRLMKALGVGLTPQIATNIYVAILTDTGSFQFSSTTADTFRIAAELADHGAEVSKIAMQVFHRNPVEKVRSMGRILSGMELDASGRIVCTVLWQKDWESAGGEDDVEGLVNYPLTIEGIDVSVFLRELGDSSFRVSMRSKNEVDVSRVATRFGGGGHMKAAGCQMTGSAAAVRDQLLASIQAEMNAAAN